MFPCLFGYPFCSPDIFNDWKCTFYLLFCVTESSLLIVCEDRETNCSSILRLLHSLLFLLHLLNIHSFCPTLHIFLISYIQYFPFPTQHINFHFPFHPNSSFTPLHFSSTPPLLYPPPVHPQIFFKCLLLVNSNLSWQLIYWFVNNLHLASDANNVDLSQFERWYNQAGTPIVEATEVSLRNSMMSIVLFFVLPCTSSSCVVSVLVPCSLCLNLYENACGALQDTPLKHTHTHTHTYFDEYIQTCAHTHMVAYWLTILCQHDLPYFAIRYLYVCLLPSVHSWNHLHTHTRRHPYRYAYTHKFIQPLTHSLTHSFTYLLTNMSFRLILLSYYLIKCIRSTMPRHKHSHWPSSSRLPAHPVKRERTNCLSSSLSVS